MKGSILLWFIVLVVFDSNAQNNYRVSGKIDKMTEGIVLLLADDSGRQDTLNKAYLKNGFFMFEGKVDGPIAVRLVSTFLEFPFILENSNITININEDNNLITGGEQQEIFNQFVQMNMLFLQEQERFILELRKAENEGDNARSSSLMRQYESVIADAHQRERELLEKYADTYAAALVVSSGKDQLELDSLKARFALLGETARATVPGRAVAGLIARLENLKEGNTAPDFTVFSLQGDSLCLYQVNSKLKLVHFWVSSDVTCRQDNVGLLDLYQRFHLKGLEIVSVSRDKNEQAWIQAVNSDGMFWRNGLDSKLQVFHLYGVRTLPCTILLDEKNRIIAKNLDIRVFKKKIREILKKNR